MPQVASMVAHIALAMTPEALAAAAQEASAAEAAAQEAGRFEMGGAVMLTALASVSTSGKVSMESESRTKFSSTEKWALWDSGGRPVSEVRTGKVPGESPIRLIIRDEPVSRGAHCIFK